MHTIKELITIGSNELKENKNKPILMSRLILQFVLKKEKEYSIVHDNDIISEEDYKKFISYIEKLKQGNPIQYITNSQEFMKLNFYVDENVLIPQPDTEILVESVIDLIKNKNLRVLDLCTGSGAIAISLGKYTDALICATDISQKALDVAIKNSKINNASNIEFKISNMFQELANAKFDVIVSNPPYIRTDEIRSLSDEVKSEPMLALDGGKDRIRVLQNNYK